MQAVRPAARRAAAALLRWADIRLQRRLGTVTAAELSRLRGELENAADTVSAEHPEHVRLCQDLEAVLAEQERRRTRHQDRQPG